MTVPTIEFIVVGWCQTGRKQSAGSAFTSGWRRRFTRQDLLDLFLNRVFFS